MALMGLCIWHHLIAVPLTLPKVVLVQRSTVCTYICLKATVVLCFSTCAAYAEGDIRLVGSTSPNEGRVEVYHNGIWGTVCDDGWDLTDATVVCQQLGLFTAIDAPVAGFFGEGSGPIWYDEVNCTGSETNITQCSHLGLGQHDCTHMKDAGVVCEGESRHQMFVLVLFFVSGFEKGAILHSLASLCFFYLAS